MKFIVFNSFLFLAIYKFSNAQEICDEVELRNLPKGILMSTLSWVTDATADMFFGCVTNAVPPIKPNDIMFFLHKRKNFNNSIRLDETNLKPIDVSKKIIFLSHGWTCTSNNDFMPELKNAYLKRYDANVILVDWSKFSIDVYANVFCAVPRVGELVGRFICALVRNAGVDASNIHMVGHSLGAHMNGIAGKIAKKTCGSTIGRITGMDPAGPLYSDVPEDDRLDASDAAFVDVIHTSASTVGYAEPCGTVDFYVNGGMLQPGCLVHTNVNVVDLPLNQMTCNHMRSCRYMLESIEFPRRPFVAYQCEDCMSTFPKKPTGTKIRKTFMGENCPVQAPGKFVVFTNSKRPFAKK